MAEQIANRIKLEFRDSKELKDAFLLKSIRGSYAAKKDKRVFRFEILAALTGMGNTE